MKYINLFTLVIACYSADQMKSFYFEGSCKTYCMSAAGYDSGTVINSKCYCMDQMDADKFSEKRLILPEKAVKAE